MFFVGMCPGSVESFDSLFICDASVHQNGLNVIVMGSSVVWNNFQVWVLHYPFGSHGSKREVTMWMN